MDIDRRLHEAGHQWRQSQGPALPAPKLDTPLQKTPPRRWMTGLIPLAASAAVAAMVIGVVVLHDAPASHQVPEGSTSTSSPTSSPTSTPTASTSAQISQPTDTTGSLTTTGKPAAESLVVTAEIKSQLLQAGAALNGLPASAFDGLMSGQTYYAYDPATATYWAGAKLVPSSSSLRAQVSVQDNGSYILFRRPAGKAWTAQDVGLAGVAGTQCTTSVPASVLTVWNWPARSCRPASIASIVPPSSVPTAGPLSAVATPRFGVLGHVTILATATLAGIPATETGQLEFDVSPGPYNQGQPASAEAVPTHGPGLYTMPTGYAPDRSGNWFVTVVYKPSPSQGTGPVPTVSGMPAPNNPHPDANLVTVVTAS